MNPSIPHIIHKNRIFMLIVIASTLGQITSDMYLPSLLAIAKGLQSNFQGAKFTLTVYMIGFAISPLIYGPLSDGIGRRYPLIWGLGLCLLGSLLCIIAPSIYFLLIGRLLQGLGAGAGSSLIRPMLRDLFNNEELAVYGSYAAILGVGALTFSPLLGGYLQQHFGWRANFIFIFLLSFSILLSVYINVPETNQHTHRENLTRQKIKSNLFALLSNPIFVSYSLLNFLAYGALFAWLTSGSILLQHTVGLNPVEYGWAYAITGIAFALGAFFNSQYVERLGTDNLLRVGIHCLTIAGVMMLGLRLIGYVNVFVIIVPTILVLFSTPLIFNNAFAGAFQPFPHIAGMAGALFATISILGGAISSSILALMPDESQYPMAFVILICAISANLIYYMVNKL